MHSQPKAICKKRGTLLKWTLSGALFGVCFPLVASLWDMTVHKLPFSLASLVQLQVQEHLFWILDLAPLVLGLAGLLIGHKQAAIVCANHDLEHKVRTRTEDLLTAKEDAEEAARAKSDFLAAMSHEIRTPMNGVLGMAQLLEKTHRDGIQRDDLCTMKSSAQALLTIIDDIPDFSKISAGKLTIEAIDFDLQNTVADICDLLLPKATSTELDLSFRYRPGTSRRLVCDPGRIRQILMNLVGNALKFTHRGHVQIDVEEISSDDNNAEIRVSVRDTGIGIAPGAQEKLFDAFTQADASTTRNFGGTGLGLSISKQLVQLMGGRPE